MKLSKEFKVGLFMVLTITMLYFGFNFLKGIDFFSSSKKYYAIYENVDKLTESNQVYLNGYEVGRVSGIQIQQLKNRVLVELEIKSDIIITDSSVALLNGDLLGSRYITLMPGVGGKRLEPKDTVNSNVAKGLMDFIAENAEPVAANLQTTMKKLNVILDNLTLNTRRLDTLFMGLQPTPRILNRTLNNASANMNELTTSIKSVTGNLNSTLVDLKPAIANFKTLSDSLKAIELNSAVQKVQVSLAKLNQTLTQLNGKDNTAGRLLTEDSLYVNLNKMIQSIDTLAAHFNENPRHFMAPLGKSRKQIEKDLKNQKDKKP
jgi:phospholipid/cholesterol/gamma-HCH transport system substrate-binding protein